MNVDMNVYLYSTKPSTVIPRCHYSLLSRHCIYLFFFRWHYF